jgi:outer membrane protein OmpA-like peptidoglycan-associated protein
MPSKSTFVLILSFAYFIFGTWLYNQIVPACQPEAEIETPHLNTSDEPVTSNWSSPEVVTNSSFEELKNKLLLGKSEDNIFEITGKYFEGETAPEGSANMGAARAEEIRKLFPELPNERIRLKSMLADDVEGMESNAFSNASFKWVAAPEKLAPVVEIGNQALIYFDNNSTVGKIDPKVEEYLAKLAEILKTSNETVSITGHTDSNGDAEINRQLGLSRAKTIQTILLKLGVPAEKITIASKGETEAVSTNDTEAGMAGNRRTVIQRVK